MILYQSEIDKLVDESILKMGRLSFTPFYCCFKEAIYRVTKPFSGNVVNQVITAARLRIPEFKEAYKSNKYRLKEVDNKCQTKEAV